MRCKGKHNIANLQTNSQFFLKKSFGPTYIQNVRCVSPAQSVFTVTPLMVDEDELLPLK